MEQELLAKEKIKQHDGFPGKYLSILIRKSRFCLEPTLSKLGLSRELIPYMMAVFEDPGISQEGITRQVYVDKATTAKTVRKLTGLGYLRREQDPEDMRKYRVYLTEEGERILSELVDTLKMMNEIYLQGFSEEERETFRSFLLRILDNVIEYKNSL